MQKTLTIKKQVEIPGETEMETQTYDEEYEIEFELDDDFWAAYIKSEYLTKDADENTIKGLIKENLIDIDSLEDDDGINEFIEGYFQDYIDDWIEDR